jgi:class 3 adenylate cyclase
MVHDRPVAAERRIVSVLFVDLVGFTSLSEGRDPEDVRALVTRYFDVAREIVERFGGTVDKYIGDAVMAWWGATASQEDDAERAVRAALEVVDRVASLGEEVGIDALAARAGVMTGEASVGPGGNERGLLLGDLVNSASRIQSIAEPGTVLVGSTTAGLVAGAIDLVAAGSHLVKGKEEPIVASRAVRTVAERGGRGRADTLEPPFVGRVSELRLLKEMLHAAGNDGRARLVSLVGQAGIGKSRLIWEFRKYTDGLVENVYWHEGRSPSYGDGIALWALAEMVRHRAGILESDDDETTLRQLRQAVADHVPEPSEQEWIGARLAGLLGVGDNAGQEREDLFSAARAFFERLSLKGTVVLVFEDLQWADPSLLEFIEELPDWSQNHPILVVTMTRPDLLERRPDWGSGRRGFTSLYVGPLTDDEMGELIGGTIEGIPPALTARIVEAAGGVPLFAVEMIRMLLSDGRLVTGPDGEMADNIDELEIPTSVQAVISARLDRLPPEDRELARDAAVLGYSFTSEGLAALGDENIDKLERRLANLVRREILELVRDPLSPERGQYRWVQSLLREVAYGRIGRADRQALHLRAARYFRDLDEPELAPVAAAHFVAAGSGAPDAALQEEMVGTLRRAIERAQAVHGHEQVLGLVETALDVVPAAARVELHETAAEAAVRVQDNTIADRHVEALAAIAAADPTHGHRAMALRGFVANETRRSELARQALEDHLASYPDLGDDPDLARIAVYLARARALRGDFLGAAELAHTALGTVEQLGMIEETADALVTMGTGLVTTRVNQGMALLRGALELCRRHGLGGTTFRALINIGFGSPDPEEAFEATRQALEEARRVGDKSHALFALGNLVDGCLVDIQLEAVAELLGDPVTSNPPVTDEVMLLGEESRLLLFRGDREGADSRLDRARELAEEVGDPQVKAGLVTTEHNFRVLDLDFAASFATAERLFDVGFQLWVPATLAMEAAALAGNQEWLAAVDDMIRMLPPGPRAQQISDWAEAMQAILAGEEDGVSKARLVAEAFRKALQTILALSTLAAAARHLPADHPERDLLAEQAREIGSGAGAEGLVDWVDRVVGTAPPSPAGV